MTREPPRPRLATTLVGIEDETANGHAPETDPPAPPRLRAMRFSTEEQVDRHDAQLDAVLGDTRFLRQWTESADEQFVELRSGQERLELGLFEVLGLVKRADERSNAAERRSRAAEKSSERASQSNEIATNFVQKKLEIDVRTDEEQLRALVSRNKMIRSWIKTGVACVITAAIAWISAWKGCHP